MKKFLPPLALAVLGLAAATQAPAQTADNEGWFLKGNVGRTSVDHGFYNSHDTGYALTGGYRWSLSPSAALGFEAGYNDLGNIDISNAFTSDPVISDTQSELHGWMAGVNGKFNLTPSWYVDAHTGVYGWRGHGVSNDDNPLRKSASTTDWYAGAGIGYDFQNGWGLGVDYDYYRARKDQLNLSTDMVSVNAEYTF